MFFVGIMGIEPREKEVAKLPKLVCRGCNSSGDCVLIKSSMVFHFFFLPLFSWRERYYVFCPVCRRVYEVSAEKGKRAENGEPGAVTYWDLNEVEPPYDEEAQKICPNCKRSVDRSFDYCPYCGKKL